jgi:hypothetical protein
MTQTIHRVSFSGAEMVWVLAERTSDCLAASLMVILLCVNGITTIALPAL